MTLLRALSMPFQLTSLLFVGASALLLALVTGVGGAGWMLSFFSIFLLLSWLNKFAFAMLEQAANGAADTPVPSVEMLGPFGGARPWVPVVLGAAAYALLRFGGGESGKAIVALALLLFPASVGGLVTTHRLIDAINPLALWRTILGLAHYYLLIVAAMAAIGTVAYFLGRIDLWSGVRYGLLELLLLSLYALIGGAIYQRRGPLGFEPRHSPERLAAKDEQQYQKRRQHMIDEVYAVVRTRDYARASVPLSQWLLAATPDHLVADVQAIMTQAAEWPEQYGLPTVTRTMVSHLIRVKRLSLALTITETALGQLPGFAPGGEAETIALANYASSAGRPGVARSLLGNIARSAPAIPNVGNLDSSN